MPVEQPEAEAPIPRPRAGFAVVAAKDIVAGTPLSEAMLTTLEYGRLDLPHGHFQEISQVRGRVALVPIRKNELIVEHRLAPVDVRTGGVLALLTPGRRAVAVQGDQIIGISGFIHPGNRVDVLVTWVDHETGENITAILLQNVPVLATGTKVQHTKTGEPAPMDVYTLELTPEETEILAHARNQGRLQFALRNPLDDESVVTEGASIQRAMHLFRGKDTPAHDASSLTVQQTVRAPRKPKSMEIIEGDTLETYTFPR